MGQTDSKKKLGRFELRVSEARPRAHQIGHLRIRWADMHPVPPRRSACTPEVVGPATASSQSRLPLERVTTSRSSDPSGFTDTCLVLPTNTSIVLTEGSVPVYLFFIQPLRPHT